MSEVRGVRVRWMDGWADGWVSVRVVHKLREGGRRRRSEKRRKK